MLRHGFNSTHNSRWIQLRLHDAKEHFTNNIVTKTGGDKPIYCRPVYCDVCHFYLRTLSENCSVCCSLFSTEKVFEHRFFKLAFKRNTYMYAAVLDFCFSEIKLIRMSSLVVYTSPYQGLCSSVSSEWAPKYLADCCVPVSDVSGRKHLRSASRRKLNIPRFRRSTFGTCELSQSPVRRFGTHCQIRCVIRPSSLSAFGGTWKRISFPDIKSWAH